MITAIPAPLDEEHHTTPPLEMEEVNIDQDTDADRRARGYMIAARCRIQRVPTGFMIYLPGVTIVCNLNFCPCSDFMTDRRPCEHIYAARVFDIRERDGNNVEHQDFVHMRKAPSIDEVKSLLAAGPVPSWLPRPDFVAMPLDDMRDAAREAEDDRKAKQDKSKNDKKPKTHFKRDPRLYERAQMNEGIYFRDLLSDIASTVPEPDHPGVGRKPISRHRIVTSLGLWAYSKRAQRPAMGDLQMAQIGGIMKKAPSRSTLESYLLQPWLKGVLSSLIEASAVPLRLLESTFAVDSTIYRSTRKIKGQKEPLVLTTKAHLITGVTTKIITASSVTPYETGDAPQLPELLGVTDKEFSIIKVVADRAYLSRDNLDAIVKLDAHPFIPPKSNTIYHYYDDGQVQPSLWNQTLYYFDAHQRDFYKHYHIRSDVEAAIGAKKVILGGKLRCRADAARINEALVRQLCYNLHILVHAIHEYGVDPQFQRPAETD